MGKVVVTADKNGNIVGISENNPEYGYVRVEQTGSFINDQGWLRISRRSALIKGLVKDLVETRFTEGQQLPGRIVVIEALEPFNTENPDRDLKIAGDTGIVCTLGGMPIYRRTKFSFNEATADTAVEHDNVDELRSAYSAQEKAKAIQPNEDFSIEG